jgi:hypothetical protein
MRVMLHYRELASWVMRYAILTLLLLGLTALVVYIVVSNYTGSIPFFAGYLSFQGSYAWVLFFGGLALVAFGMWANIYKERTTRYAWHWTEGIGSAGFPLIFRVYRAFTIKKTENCVLLIAVGATLFVIAVCLLWVWNI